MSKEKITLRVKPAQTRDAGRGIARIDTAIAKRLGLSPGDIVEIQGSKRTACIYWPAYPEDRGLSIIRLDGSTRRNANTGIDEKVELRRVEAKYATEITFAPTEPIRIQGAEMYLRRILEGRVITSGDYVEIPTMQRKILLIVAFHKPKSEAVIVNPDTQIKLSAQPISEIERKMPKITYEDIGGLHDEIRKVRETIELPMKHPELFQRLGIEPPKGVLLFGPPGTGKTLLAKAVAHETDANFVSLSGPEVMSKFYGESESRLRDIFKNAEKDAPSIIFIDEIDSIAPKREEVTGEVERRVVAQLLALMDGLETRGQVIVIGATNRPNALDPALRRGGRFDREIEIGIPDRDARLEILMIHTRGMPLTSDVDLEELANRTHGFVGADLASLTKEAAMITLRKILPEIDLEADEIPAEILEKIEVTRDDFINAMNDVEPSALREVFVEIPDVAWDDIGGLSEAKQELKEAVEWPLLYRNHYKHFNANPPSGILLYGPPGTGKTLIAKAVANESEANFISVKGPEFLSKWVGESEKAVRETLRKARSAAPCVVFFDEFDAIAPARGGLGDSRVTERVISQLLTELDGLEQLRGVVVIAATNRPDLIDPALLRPGRFDRLIEIGAPDQEARSEIFKIHTRNRPLAEDVNLENLAKKTENMTGADIAAICNQAVMYAIRDSIQTTGDSIELEELINYKITREHFERALEKEKTQRKPRREARPSSMVV
ncbi:MAG: CDC48 family AAA ATPase [Promethearchaeota archaeon]